MCHRLSPQGDVMSSSRKEPSTSLVDLSTIFLATIVDAKDFICQVESTFCSELWPSVCAELANARCRVMELERRAEEDSKEREQREQLESERENERTRLLAENGELRSELDKLSKHQAEGVHKEGTSVEIQRLVQENNILQDKLELLLEENLNGAKQRKSLTEELEQLQEAAKLSTIKEMVLEAENKKFAKARSQIEKSALKTENRKSGAARPQIEKSEDLHGKRLSSKGQKKLAKDESPSSITAGRDSEPASPKDPQNSQNGSTVQSPYQVRRPDSNLQDNDQDLDCGASDVGKEEVARGKSPVDPEADIAVGQQAAALPVERPPSPDAMGEGEKAKDPEAVDDAQDIASPERLKENCEAESSPSPPPGFVDSDATTLGLDAFQEGHFSVGSVEEYPIISISSETQGAPRDYEPLQLPPGRVIAGVRRRSVEQKVEEEDRPVAQKAAPLVSIPPNLPSKVPSPKTKGSKTKPVKKPKEQSWRQTRHRTEPSDKDPHDSFLDTPRDRVLAHLGAAKGEECATGKGCQGPLTSKLDGGSVEAREGEKAVRSQEHKSASSRLVVEASNACRPDRTGAKTPALKAPPFKFNEPVRKKRDREALLGTDCKQCKKFYDAVAAEDADGMNASRCEHQNAVSRHRFKFLPPPTPDGFWNIGFDDSLNSQDLCG